MVMVCSGRGHPTCCPRAVAPSPALPLGESTASSCSPALASEGRAQNSRAAPRLSRLQRKGGSFLPFCGKPEDAPFFLPLCLRVMRSPRPLVRKDRFHLTAPHTHICMLKAVLTAFVSNGDRSHLPGGDSDGIR